MGILKKLLVIGLSLTLLATGLILLQTQGSEYKTKQILQKEKAFTLEFDNCSKNDNTPYECYLGSIEKFSSIIPYSVMLVNLTKGDPLLRMKGYCHNTLHELGKYYYDDIVGTKKVPTTCGDALFHGVIQEASKRNDNQKIKDLLESSCKDSSGNYSDVCIHGIGHVLWESTQDINQFISKCVASTGENIPQYAFYILTCVDGFLMKASKNTILKPNEDFIAADLIEVDKSKFGWMLQECQKYESDIANGCDGLVFRWYYPNYLKHYPNIKFDQYNYMQEKCAEIVDEFAKNLCNRQTGIMVYDYAIYFNDYSYKPVELFCSKEMLLMCFDAYFEHYLDFPAIYINTHKMDEYEVFANKICQKVKDDFLQKECILMKDRKKVLSIK